MLCRGSPGTPQSVTWLEQRPPPGRCRRRSRSPRNRHRCAPLYRDDRNHPRTRSRSAPARPGGTRLYTGAGTVTGLGQRRRTTEVVFAAPMTVSDGQTAAHSTIWANSAVCALRDRVRVADQPGGRSNRRSFTKPAGSSLPASSRRSGRAYSSTEMDENPPACPARRQHFPESSQKIRGRTASLPHHEWLLGRLRRRTAAFHERFIDGPRLRTRLYSNGQFHLHLFVRFNSMRMYSLPSREHSP